jgi:hypothetical protein
MNKPEYSENILCICGSGDTTSLKFPAMTTGKVNFVCWCSCGLVTVRNEGKEFTVFDFKDI